MADTAQPAAPAAETEVVSRADSMQAAADAFKVSLGQIEAPAADPPRGADGRFASQAPEAAAEGEDEIDAPAAGDDPDAGAESQEDAAIDAEAADEAQPSDAELPTSWPAEQAELWKTLPPEAQAVIAEREGQRDAAVNAKFQEAANLRKAHEAEIGEANLNRQRYAEAVDQVLSLVVPQMPPRSMLDAGSGDYDPDAYHYQKALYEDTIAFLDQHKSQRQQAVAQADMARFQTLNNATRDAFIASVPDIAVADKAPAMFQELIDYAVTLGTPAETFDAPTSALEWHVLWKAREYDRLQAAKAKVQTGPKPEPRKPQPAVRPGVTTPRSAIEHKNRGQALDRLRKEGSVDAGAAAIKLLLKGRLG